MKKHFLFIIFAILSTIFLIAFAMTTYRYYQALHRDDPIDPYVLVEEGKVTVTRGTQAIDMDKNETYDLKEGDVIITRVDSRAVINWPDHSTTRLAANSRLTIEKMRVASDYSRIELVASLENGKAWSNMVRTLYPGSQIELRLPKVGTVAGVRGTVFDINLDANYIESIDHSVSLRNLVGQTVLLLPGEAVRADNILLKISTGIDGVWHGLNVQKDAIYSEIRTQITEVSYLTLQTKKGILGWWDAFVRWILSFFAAFRDLPVIEAISMNRIDTLMNLPQEKVMEWYQKFQSNKFVKERESLRNALVNFRLDEKFMDSLARGAYWDKLSFSGMTLDTANQLLSDYAKKSGTTMEALNKGIEAVRLENLTEQGKSAIQKLFQ